MRHYKYIISLVIAMISFAPVSAQKKSSGDSPLNRAKVYVSTKSAQVGKRNSVLKLKLDKMQAVASGIHMVYSRSDANFTSLMPELTRGKFKTDAQENRYIDKDYNIWITAKDALKSPRAMSLVNQGSKFVWKVSVMGPDKSEPLYTYDFNGNDVKAAIALFSGSMPDEFTDYLSRTLAERAMRSILIQVYLPHDSIGMCNAVVNGNNLRATMLTTHAGYAKMKDNFGAPVRNAWLGTFTKTCKLKTYFEDLYAVFKARKISADIVLRDMVTKDSTVYHYTTADILKYAGKPDVREVAPYLVQVLGGKLQDGANSGSFIAKYGPNAESQKGLTAAPEAKTKKVYDVVEEMPQFPGGAVAMEAYILQNLRYPPEAEEKNIYGRVLCSFTVTKTGEIQNVEIVKSANKLLESEAIRVISTMPKWIAARHNGERVNAKYQLPITFKLSMAKKEDEYLGQEKK